MSFQQTKKLSKAFNSSPWCRLYQIASVSLTDNEEELKDLKGKLQTDLESRRVCLALAFARLNYTQKYVSVSVSLFPFTFLSVFNDIFSFKDLIFFHRQRGRSKKPKGGSLAINKGAERPEKKRATKITISIGRKKTKELSFYPGGVNES